MPTPTSLGVPATSLASSGSAGIAKMASTTRSYVSALCAAKLGTAQLGTFWRTNRARPCTMHAPTAASSMLGLAQANARAGWCTRRNLAALNGLDMHETYKGMRAYTSRQCAHARDGG